MLLNGKYRECADYLATLNVLPNEGASEGRTVYREAWLYCALQNVAAGNYHNALADVEQSKLWPEHLGVGKPFDEDIDLRTEDFITAYCNAKLNAQKPPVFTPPAVAAYAPLTLEVMKVCK
jgi:hypothetical protein